MKLRPGLVGRAVCDRLAELASEVPSDQAIVEIGVFMARTTCYLGQGSKRGNGAHVWGIDPWDLPGERYPFKFYQASSAKKRKIRTMFTQESTRLTAESNVASSGLKNITLVRDFSANAAAEWTGPHIGLLFIDGNHEESFVRQDWESWSTNLAEGATVAWDDYEPNYPGVVNVVDELVASGVLTLHEVFNNRLAVTCPSPS